MNKQGKKKTRLQLAKECFKSLFLMLEVKKGAKFSHATFSKSMKAFLVHQTLRNAYSTTC